MSILRTLSFLVALFVTVASSLAQQPSLIPEKLERETVVDDKGLTQFAEWKDHECEGCKGKGKVKCTTCERYKDDAKFCLDCERKPEREAPCRICGGEGKRPDPLEKATCPTCHAASFVLCPQCAGGGQLFVGGDKRATKCPVCSGDGGWKCTTCDGKRFVDMAAFKPSFVEVKDKDLHKALAQVDGLIKDLEAFAPLGGAKVRKEVKAFAKILEGGQATYPALKREIKSAEDLMNKVYNGAQFQGQAEREAETLKQLAATTAYYLKHQKRMMELLQKRNEANAAVVGEATDKNGKGK